MQTLPVFSFTNPGTLIRDETTAISAQGQQTQKTSWGSRGSTERGCFLCLSSTEKIQQRLEQAECFHYSPGEVSSHSSPLRGLSAAAWPSFHIVVYDYVILSANWNLPPAFFFFALVVYRGLSLLKSWECLPTFQCRPQTPPTPTAPCPPRASILMCPSLPPHHHHTLTSNEDGQCPTASNPPSSTNMWIKTAISVSLILMSKTFPSATLPTD